MRCECGSNNVQLYVVECSVQFCAASNRGCCAAVWGQQGVCLIRHAALTSTAHLSAFHVVLRRPRRCLAAWSFTPFLFMRSSCCGIALLSRGNRFLASDATFGRGEISLQLASKGTSETAIFSAHVCLKFVLACELLLNSLMLCSLRWWSVAHWGYFLIFNPDKFFICSFICCSMVVTAVISIEGLAKPVTEKTSTQFRT